MKSYQKDQLDSIAYELAEIALKTGSFHFSEKPVEWEFGYYMPVDSNFDRLTNDVRGMDLIIQSFDLIKRFSAIEFDIIAGNSTSGGPPAAVLRYIWKKNGFTYRPIPKNSKGNIVELMSRENLEGKRVLLVENRIETGRSSSAAVQEIRNYGGGISHCFVIFDYKFAESAEVIAGKKPYANTNKLQSLFEVHSALDYDKIIEVAKHKSHFTEEQFQIMEKWHADPYNYGEKHGHPRIVR